MITIAATVGFLIVAFCITIFFADFALLNMGKKPFLGLPDMGAARWLAGWLFAGVFLLMLTFPDLISGYKQCTEYLDSRGINIDAPMPEKKDETE